MPTRNVVLTASQSEMVEALVKSGRYQNASEVLRDGLRLLAQREAENAQRLDGLRQDTRLGAAGLADMAEGAFAVGEERVSYRAPGPVARALLESYSRGDISRTELERRAGIAVDFGDLLGLLRAAGLPLPRPAIDPDGAGVALVRRLAESRDGAG